MKPRSKILKLPRHPPPPGGYVEIPPWRSKNHVFSTFLIIWPIYLRTLKCGISVCGAFVISYSFRSKFWTRNNIKISYLQYEFWQFLLNSQSKKSFNFCSKFSKQKHKNHNIIYIFCLPAIQIFHSNNLAAALQQWNLSRFSFTVYQLQSIEFIKIFHFVVGIVAREFDISIRKIRIFQIQGIN